MSGRRRGRQTTSNSRSKRGITDTVRAVSAASNVPKQKKTVIGIYTKEKRKK